MRLKHTINKNAHIFQIVTFKLPITEKKLKPLPEQSVVALFIDADNAPANKIEFIINELAGYGSVMIRKIYGNWKEERHKVGKPYYWIMHLPLCSNLITRKARMLLI